MTEQLRQSLSAVIDGEADAFELRRVLDELERDPELRAAWDRYHLIGSVIRGERTRQSQATARALARRVPQAVRESSAERGVATAVVPAGTGDARSAEAGRGRRGAVGIALAASVALATAVAFVGFESGPGPVEPALVVEAAAPVEREIVVAAPVAGQDEPGRFAREELVAAPVAQGGFAAASPSDLRRAHAYMLQHAQQRGFEQTGVISLVKMATYEAP
jgi:sigma-E factor negative regulatory protein RseA